MAVAATNHTEVGVRKGAVLDQAEFRLFYEKTAPTLHGYIARSCGSADLADDILQDACLRFLRTAPHGMEERQMRARTKTLISLLAPALILVVGALVGFMVIALLLPIFKMSRAIH